MAGLEDVKQDLVGKDLETRTESGVKVSPEFLEALKKSKKPEDQKLYGDLVANYDIAANADNTGYEVTPKDGLDALLNTYETAYLRTQVERVFWSSNEAKISIANGEATITLTNLTEPIVLAESGTKWIIGNADDGLAFDDLSSALHASYFICTALNKLGKKEFDAPTDPINPFTWDGNRLTFQDEWMDSDILVDINASFSPDIRTNIAKTLNKIFRRVQLDEAQAPQVAVETAPAAPASAPEKLAETAARVPALASLATEIAQENPERVAMAKLIETTRLYLESLNNPDEEKGKQFEQLVADYQAAIQKGDLLNETNLEESDLGVQIEDLASEIQAEFDAENPNSEGTTDAAATEEGGAAEDASVDAGDVAASAEEPAEVEVTETDEDRAIHIQADAQAHPDKYIKWDGDHKSFTFMTADDKGSSEDLAVRIQDVVQGDDRKLVFKSSRLPGEFTYGNGGKGFSWYNTEGGRLGMNAGDVISVVEPVLSEAEPAAEPTPAEEAAPTPEVPAAVAEAPEATPERVFLPKEAVQEALAIAEGNPDLIKGQQEWLGRVQKGIEQSKGKGRKEGLKKHAEEAQQEIAKLQEEQGHAIALLNEQKDNPAYAEVVKGKTAQELVALNLPAPSSEVTPPTGESAPVVVDVGPESSGGAV